MKQTPGPWAVRPTSRAGNGTGWRDIVSEGAAVGPTYVGEALEQDAALIASAPELLAALQTAVESAELAAIHEYPDGGDLPWFAACKSAIAKAEGRT